MKKTTDDEKLISALNEETIQALEDMNKKIGLSRGFSSVEELMEDLNTEI